MHTFKATKDGVFLDDLRVQACAGYQVIADAGEYPEVILRITCGAVDIEESGTV